MSQMNYLSFYFKKLEMEEQIKPKVSTELKKIKVKIIEIENRKTIKQQKKTVKPKAGFMRRTKCIILQID